MLINGSNLDVNVQNKNEKCFLPIFRHHLPSINQTMSAYKDTWIAGSHLLSNYYVVYDMESPGDNNVIGIANKNPKDQIGSPEEPEEAGWLKNYMDLMIAVIVLSLLCLFLICFFQFRKRHKDN